MKRMMFLAAAVILAAQPSCAPPPRHTLDCRFLSRVEHVTMKLPMVKVAIDRDGRVKWNDVPIDPRTLELYFAEAGQQDPQPDILIATPDSDTPYSAVAPVLRLMDEKKVHRLGIETWHTWRVPPLDIPAPIAVGCALGPLDPPAPTSEEVLDIAADGTTRWNGEAVSVGQLSKNLDRAARTTPQPLLRLKIDPKAQMRQVTDVMFEVAANFERMRFDAD